MPPRWAGGACSSRSAFSRTADPPRRSRHPAQAAGEAHARALAARLQAFTGEHDAGLDQLLVVLAHRRQQLLAGHLAGFRVLARLHDDHESHGRLSVSWTAYSTSASSDRANGASTPRAART